MLKQQQERPSNIMDPHDDGTGVDARPSIGSSENDAIYKEAGSSLAGLMNFAEEYGLSRVEQSQYTDGQLTAWIAKRREDSPKKIETSDIGINIPSTDGTRIIVQRHEKYIRDENDPTPGSLVPGAAIKEYEDTVDRFREMLESINPEEQKEVDVLVIASDTHFKDHEEWGQRCMETAQKIIEGIKIVLDEHNLSHTQLLNEHEIESASGLKSRFRGETGQPRPTKNVREPEIFTKSPDFVRFLEEQSGGEINQQFWVDFESDTYHAKREEMGAEGPWQMADRLAKFIDIISRYSEKYHKENPGRRLIIWTASHYDLISPYLRRHVLKLPKSHYLPVDYGAGFSFNLETGEDKTTTTIGGKKYPIAINPYPAGRPTKT